MTVEERVAASSGIERLEAEAGPHVRRAPVRLRMTERASELDAAELADDMGDDTIELALTEEDMRTLSRAAEGEHVETSPGSSARSAAGVFLRDQSIRSRRWLPVLAALALGVGISIALGVVAHRISTMAATGPTLAERSADSVDAPVRFSNPFDASEIFEFPSGTSDEEARQSVAAILLQRAHDRQVADPALSNRPMPGTAAHRARIARSSDPRRT